VDAVEGPTSALPRARRPLGRNDRCHCGSHQKYKRCCLVADQNAALEARGVELPREFITSTGKLHQFIRYICQVYAIPRLLGQLTDGRRRAAVPTLDVVAALFMAGVLRLPSINALEGDLQESDFQSLLGLQPTPGRKAFSAEVISNTLDSLRLSELRENIDTVIWRAERNKALRDDTFGALRCVAVDGWEPFCSYDRHCSHCLSRQKSHKDAKTGEIVERTQYYHRFVVAMMVAPRMDLVLDIEPVRSGQARRDAGEDEHHEGELTAALRLIDRLHATYGSFIDAFLLDALYANGPVMTKLTEHGYGGFIVLKKNNNEPLQEALALWEGQPRCSEYTDADTHEHVEFWDVDGIETLSSYAGPVRVIRAVVTKGNSRKTWCFAIVGKRARSTGRRTALKLIRARWHIENTAFNQWVQHWNLAHVYRHTGNAIQAILLLWALVFNLLQLFVYRRLKRARNPKEPTDTIRHIVEMMMRDLGALIEPLRWAELADTS
jgi:hypothetical protein